MFIAFVFLIFELLLSFELCDDSNMGYVHFVEFVIRVLLIMTI